MIVTKFIVYLYVKIYLTVNIFTLYQYGYISSLYLNNQTINIVILIIIFSLVIRKIKNANYIFLSSYLFFYTLTLISKNKILEWPSSLLVGLNTIHPYLYYCSFILLLITLSKFFFFNNIIFKNTILYIAIIALFLGMMWGSVNDLWGFFWVNDLVELVLLLLISLLIHYIHVYSKYVVHSFIVSFFTLIVILYSIRLGIGNSRHSFFLDLQLSSYTNYMLGIFLYLNTVVLSYIRLYCIAYTYIILLVYFYLLLLCKQLIIYRKFIDSKFFLIGHLSILFLVLYWLFNISNFILYYNFRGFTVSIKQYVYSYSSMYNNYYIVLVNTKINNYMSILSSYSTVVYLYKLYIGLFNAFISFSYFFINVFVLFFFKKYFFSQY